LYTLQGHERGFLFNQFGVVTEFGREGLPMEWGITSLADLQRMKDKMDRVWKSLLDETPIAGERETWQWVEKLPKFEGTGRRSFKSRSNKNIKS
jgi:hypothetical protein